MAKMTTKQIQEMRAFRRSVLTLLDGNRIRILLGLRRREIPVGELAKMLEVDSSTVSRHLDRLEQAGLIERYHEPPNVAVRRLRDSDVPKDLREAADWIEKRFRNHEMIVADAKWLEKNRDTRSTEKGARRSGR